MPRVNPRDPSVGTGGSGVPIFDQPIPDVLTPQPTPTTWEIPTLPDWLKPSLPSQPTGAGQPNQTPDGGTYTSDQAEEKCVDDPLCKLGIGAPCKCKDWFEGTILDTTPTNGNGAEEKCVDDPLCKLGIGAPCKCKDWFEGTILDTTPEIDEHGCECEACKNGTGQCSDKVPQCNAWDLGCEATGGKVDETFFWIKIIAVVIGIGVFLWLLRPLFSRGGQRPSGIALTPI